MKSEIYVLAIFVALIVSCSVENESNMNKHPYPTEVFASIENVSATPETKVYADESLKVLWDNDDRITLFNKYTYNKEYYFAGKTGSNSGTFKEVSKGNVIVGNELDYVYAIYPYREETEISNLGIITLNLPAEQSYKENSFGNGANTMVSATTDTDLKFRNLCGYLVLKLYGEGVSVSSLTIKGNNDEILAGKVDVTADVGSTPSLSFRSDEASKELFITCDTPVKLGASAAEATTFWMVIPPTIFTDGFTLTVTDPAGNTFKKSTAMNFEIKRNKTFRMGTLEVEMIESQPNNVIYYTSTDGATMSVRTEKIDATLVSNDYVNGVGVLTFDSPITTIGRSAFTSSTLKTISLPSSVVSVDPRAFACRNLQKFEGKYGEGRCLVISGELVSFAPGGGITEFQTPKGVSSIGPYAFYECKDLKTLIVSDGVEKIDERAFELSGLKNLLLPETLREVGYRFLSGTSVASLSLPSKVQIINDINHVETITAIEINNTIPASISDDAFGINSTYPIYIPTGSLSLFSSAWPSYAGRLREKSGSPLNVINYTTSDGNKVSFESGYTNIAPVWEQNGSILSHTYGEIAFYAPVTEIPHDTFLRSKLTSISLPNSVVTLCSNCFDSSNLESIILSSNIEEIQWCSFSSCLSLKTVLLPESLKTIGSYAFAGCKSLATIVIPEKVTKISDYAFNGCSNLYSITVTASVPPTGGDDMFVGTNDCPIYVPSYAIDAYKEAQYWSDYAERIRPIPEE